ncbi:MAG: carbonic anhydrase [Micrococcales bacterium]
MARPTTPQESWDALLAGNARFLNGDPAHPRQDIDRVEDLADGQAPFAALFGCADSRLSAEIIFDLGLGDLFVVRNAGQVIGGTVLGSLEYAVEVLKVPLILVLGHDNCGAIKATIEVSEGKVPATGEHIHQLASLIMPTVRLAQSQGIEDINTITQMHIKDTVDDMLRDSRVVAEAVKAGKLGVVGANYSLEDGKIEPLFLYGNIK